MSKISATANVLTVGCYVGSIGGSWRGYPAGSDAYKYVHILPTYVSSLQSLTQPP
ncbi:hypothetical protein BJ508DRAFT_411384 [Ascobolus immersus RN42]|uniref:Uncharacterized protein n=1 Tax=Ascobolus immersus RN42 TaxID=1160509 RepID=A0A3N4IPS1_ASCIM|nr:hypothetical protein BJ508DRAFT_411384 [Ascobolus immersus RN42]